MKSNPPVRSMDDRTLGFLVASLATSYPDDECASHLRTLLDDKEIDAHCRTQMNETWESLRALLQDALGEESKIDAIRSEYIDTFERGRSANPLYESEYGRDRALAKGNALADLAGFYRAFGLDPDSDGTKREMLDHVAVELEFYAYLMMKQAALTRLGNEEGAGIVRDARKAFLKDHLGRFVGAIAERPGVAAHPYYSKMFIWCRDLISEECCSLGVLPDTAQWTSDARLQSAETDEMSCASSCSTSSSICSKMEKP